MVKLPIPVKVKWGKTPVNGDDCMARLSCVICTSTQNIVCGECYLREKDEMKREIEELERRIEELERARTQ